MRRQVRPYLAVVANGFARRVGVELAGPACCLIPAGGMQMGVPSPEPHRVLRKVTNAAPRSPFGGDARS